MDDTAAHYCRLQEQLETDRALYEATWREIAERVRPNSNYFSTDSTPGSKRDQWQFDDTAPLALTKFNAACISYAFPFNTRYQKLTVNDPRLAEIDSVKRYFERLTEILFKVRYTPAANWQPQLSEMVDDVGAFGTGVLFTNEIAGKGIRYKAIPLSEAYFTEDAAGGITTLHRKFQMTALQAVEWAKQIGGRLPEKITTAAEKYPLHRFWFMHCVSPNEERIASRRDYRGMAFKSTYVAMETKDTVGEGGFHSFPYAVTRFQTAPREVYGRGPGTIVLRTIKALNEMKKTIIRAGQLVVAPPIMLSDDASLNGFDLRSNALNFGYMNNEGRPMAAPFNSGGRVDMGVELMEREAQIINDAFFVTLFRILIEEPQITATEAMLRAQEKGQLLSPTIGRMQAEIGGGVTARELDLIMRADMLQKRMGGQGFLPDMPDELLEAEGGYEIEYEAPLNQAQKAGDGVAILNTIQSITPIGAALGEDAARSMARIFNPERTMRKLAAANAAPQDIMNTPEELAALDEQDAAAAEASAILQAAPVAAGAAKDLAQAGALAAGSPSGPAPALFPA